MRLGSRACVCLRGCGTAWRRSAQHPSISCISRKRSTERRTIPLPLDRPSPLTRVGPRAVSPDIMVHIRSATYTRAPSFSSTLRLSPPPSFSSSTTTPSSRAIRHSYNSARCKLHNLVTVSPRHRSLSNDTAFIMREVRRPRSFPRIIVDRYR